MIKRTLSLLVILTACFVFVRPVQAFRPETFVSVTVPVYELPKDSPITTLTNIDLIYKLSTPSAMTVTWLLGYDSLISADTRGYFNVLLASDKHQEVGLRLDVGRELLLSGLPGTDRNDFAMPRNNLLLGYSQPERLKLIDAAMKKFLDTFGFYPRTVAAPYLDSFSLEYLARHYSVQTAVRLGDKKITFVDAYHPERNLDLNMQPYFPSRTNALQPAPDLVDKIKLPLVTWNLPEPGQDVPLDLTQISIKSLESYLKYWEQKSLNEFTHIAFGTDNRLQTSVTLDVYTLLFDTVRNMQERISGQWYSLAQFGDWFIARHPLTSPAYYFADFNKQYAEYANPFYRVKLKAEGDRTRVDQITWYVKEESEPYWYQALTTDELRLPIYNQSSRQLLDFDLTKSVFAHEYWDVILSNGDTWLRFEPRRILSSWPLEWVDTKFVKYSRQGSDYSYSMKTFPQANDLAPVAALGVVVLILLLQLKSKWKKTA